ncbi:MAG: carbon storage regulator CsrA [Oscillospiraceae bacterium]|nr:carbon storage regulator CsrA [Oscillospiraceae bacterium]
MLILSRKSGESFMLNNEIEIKITEITADCVKIGIDAPKNYKIVRKELLQTVESNKAAAAEATEASKKELLKLFSNVKK